MEENDVGERRRVLNSFLQFIEQDKSNSIVVAATNSPKPTVLFSDALIMYYILNYHTTKKENG